MTRFATICVALLIAAPVAAQDVPPPSASPAIENLEGNVIDAESNPQQFDLARRKVVDCEGEKFVFAWGAGAKPTKVTICSKKNATPDELVQLLEHHAAIVEQTTEIPDDRRVAIVQQIRGKISELKGASAAAPRAAEPPAAAARVPVAPARPAVQPSVNAVASQARPVSAPVLPAKPRLSFACYTPGELGSGGQCTILTRDTRLTVKAGEALAGATSLRFVRNGESRAEVALSQLRQGQSVRLTVPRPVCAGVVEAETEIEIVRAGRVVDSIGPYLLRC